MSNGTAVRILEMRDENLRLQRQVSRLRRLLGEAEQRFAAAAGRRVGFTRAGRHLPDVTRPDLDELLDT